MACLVLDFEGLDVITHELISDAVTIGRAPSNDIVIDHPTVSAQHARLTKSPSGYRIKDLEATNGTQINGVSISDAQLKDGAEIRFGYITDFSAMRPQALIRSGNCNSPGNTTALARFEFQKRSQLFIGAHNETLSFVPMCVNNPDRSPVAIHRCNATPTPSCFAEIVSDDFPALPCTFRCSSNKGLAL
jgi:hypothetical protein